MVEILKYDIRTEILSINGELEIGYQLKELFLDIINHATYEDAKQQLLNKILSISPDLKKGYNLKLL